uniref:DUF421 domain-containing protein n=1 Tax=uncultured Allobacillus sp. TaxID=1638025 RepID=UPI002594119B|nr:DUF421 domain-containing protein [uncultured Allobacillus sp.]
MGFGSIALEVIIGFIALFILTKILGKTQMNQITVFDFISVMVLGELVGNAVYDQDVGIQEILFAVALWGALVYAIDFFTLKVRKSRKILEGMPSILVRRGIIQYDELKRNKLDLSQMLQLLRDKDVFSLREVEYAIFEPSGTINVLKKHNYQQPDHQALNIPEQDVYLPITIIADGEIVEENLDEIEWDENRVIMEVERQGYQLKDIVYAEWEKGKGLFILSSE